MTGNASENVQKAMWSAADHVPSHGNQAILKAGEPHTVVREIDPGMWRAFIDDTPGASIFHTPEMFEVFKRAAGHIPELWATVDAVGRPLALFTPVRITVLGGPLSWLTGRAVAFGSVLCAPGPDGQQALDALLNVYNQGRGRDILFTELRNVSELNGLQPILKARGYHYEEYLNFLIDLTRPETKLWSNIRSNARRNIRKAQADGVVVNEVEDPADIPSVYTVLKAVYKRIQVPLPDESLFRSAFDVLRPSGMMRVLVAKAGDTSIGVLTLLIAQGVMTYWYTGTLREYSLLRPADLLVWEALKLGAESGYRVFDFGGGGRAAEEYGVRDFKAKFGGELVSFGRNTCVHAPQRLRLSRTSYQIVRRFL
jgi:hypothetical protein